MVPGKYFLRLRGTTDESVQNLAGVTGFFHNMNAAELTLNPLFNPEDPSSIALYPAEAEKLSAALSHPRVQYGQPDVYVVPVKFAVSSTPLDYAKDLGLAANVSSTPYSPTAGNWGLQFLASADLTKTGAYMGVGNQGDGVDVYVFGTGINVDHPQLKGKYIINL